MTLSHDDLGPDPLRALQRWFVDAREQGLGEEFPFTLATVDEAGAPDARPVIVRAVDDEGLTYYADTRSPKGRHVARDPRAAMSYFWPGLKRHVRVRGHVVVAPRPESDAAFASRERRSQIGYWTSHQSRPVADRAALEAQQDATVARFEHEELTRPEHWVVYRLQPDYVEFWQSGERHLHDRIAYTRTGEGGWRAERLQP